MHHHLLSGCLILALPGCGAPLRPSQGNQKHSAPVADDACPLKEPADWRDFLRDAASDEHLVDTCEDGGCDAKRLSHMKDQVGGTLARCAPVIEADPKIKKCTEHLRT